MISWGLTTPAGAATLAGGNSFQGVSRAGASNALAANLGGAQTLGVNNLYLDVVIETKTRDNVRQLIVVGDSNSIGYNPSVPAGGFSGAGAACLPHECWPMLAGAMGGFDVINLGVGSTTAAEWGQIANGFTGLWDRIPTGATPVAAINSIGANSLGGNLGSFISAVGPIHTKERSLGIGNIFWTTITGRAHPNGSYDGGATAIAFTLANDAPAGQTQVTLSAPPSSGSVILIGNGTNLEKWTVSSAAGNVATLAAPLANAHYAGEPAGQGNELNRMEFNQFLRQIPDGAAAVFDFDKAMEKLPGSPMMDSRYAASDWLHRQRGAQAPLASLVAAAGSKPLFG